MRSLLKLIHFTAISETSEMPHVVFADHVLATILRMRTAGRTVFVLYEDAINDGTSDDLRCHRHLYRRHRKRQWQGWERSYSLYFRAMIRAMTSSRAPPMTLTPRGMVRQRWRWAGGSAGGNRFATNAFRANAVVFSTPCEPIRARALRRTHRAAAVWKDSNSERAVSPEPS